MRVLVVEDYQMLASAMRQTLEEAGYAVDLSNDGDGGALLAETHEYDAIVLDWMLPGQDGLSIVARLRTAGRRTPVLMITARDRANDQVQGLDAGADDYLTKPFEMSVMLARVRALIRRSYGQASSIRVADLEIDTKSRLVRRGDRVIPLSAREYALLEYLAMRRGHIVTRAEILDHLYDYETDPMTRVVDVHMAHLRRKVDGEQGVKLLHTRRGQGYVLDVESGS